MEKISEIIVEAGQKVLEPLGNFNKNDKVIDLYCGVELKVQIGTAVEKGDVIAKIYSKDVNNAAILKAFEAIKIEDNIPPKPQMILAIEN